MNRDDKSQSQSVDQGPTNGRWTTESPPDRVEIEYDIRELIRENTLNQLTHRQELDFVSEMECLYRWLMTKGNKIDEQDPRGHEKSTTENYIKRLSRMFPYFWNQNGGYTLQFTREMGDWYVKQLQNNEICKDNETPYAGSSKRKQVCALLNFFRFRWDCRNGPSWEPFSLFGGDSGARVADPVTLDERTRIREAALKYKTVKRYNNCTPEERDRIKAELAQRLGKPKSEVTKEDWTKTNRCWKWPSIILTGLDTGLRPVEVKRAKMDWPKLSVPELEIPKDDAAKNSQTWNVPITERTARALQNWKRQREVLPKYDDSEHIWLTREGNPYSSGPLGRNLRRIMEEAGINFSDRNISWYSLRYSLGTYLAMSADDIEQVRRQMRHKRITSTLKYIESQDEVRDNLNSIN